jgi:hypothetical protein
VGASLEVEPGSLPEADSQKGGPRRPTPGSEAFRRSASPCSRDGPAHPRSGRGIAQDDVVAPVTVYVPRPGELLNLIVG